MAEISDADLKAMTQYITELEAQVDYLMRERILLKEGAAALAKQMPSNTTAEALRGPPPPGHDWGHAGQLILVDGAYRQPR